MDSAKPAYYAVLPAKVRYDPELRPNAKLLYAEITALANASGYCFASNAHLAGLFGLSAKTISELVSQLARHGYLSVEIVQDAETGEILERRIYVDTPRVMDTPIPKNQDTPYTEKSGDPIPKNREDNITSNNINNITPKAPQGGRKRKAPKSIPDHEPERFEKFWACYPAARRKDRPKAVEEWDRLKASPELLDEIARGLKILLASEDWRNGIGIPYPCRFLRNRRWEDAAAVQEAPRQPTSDGYVYDPEVY